MVQTCFSRVPPHRALVQSKVEMVVAAQSGAEVVMGRCRRQRGWQSAEMQASLRGSAGGS
jgi:hypothetical protein